MNVTPTKKGEEFDKNNTIGCLSLKSNCSFEAWGTKQGGKRKTWKKRYFMLVQTPNQNGMAELYYFKTEKAKTATGVIKLNERSTVKDLPQKGGKAWLSIDTGINIGKRTTYLLYCSSSADQDKFKKALVDKIASLKKKVETKPATTGGATPAGISTSSGAGAGQPAAGAGQQAAVNHGIKLALENAKNAIPFLSSEEGDKTLEFFQIWTDSIPSGAPEVSVTLVMTADMSQLSWRVYGPQNVLIQEMVDFFWNVGAPEQEIDRLNEVGGLINPLTIGSWIDMSTKGGMDGGWVFPVQVNITDALKACDEGTSRDKLTEWTQARNITECVTVGRDMGASPPRQTEVRFPINGETFDARFNLAMEAYKEFGFTPIPGTHHAILKDWNPVSMELSVITSSEGFVRIGMILPDPDQGVVTQLCAVSVADHSNIVKFQNKLNIPRPAFVEFQFLMDTFGYGVYNEGLNIVFHYNLDPHMV